MDIVVPHGVIEGKKVTVLTLVKKVPIPERLKKRIVELTGASYIKETDKYRIVFNRRLPDSMTRKLGQDLGIEFPELVTKRRRLFNFNHEHPVCSVKQEEKE